MCRGARPPPCRRRDTQGRRLQTPVRQPAPPVRNYIRLSSPETLCTERPMPTPQPTPAAKNASFAAKETSGQKITENMVAKTKNMAATTMGLRRRRIILQPPPASGCLAPLSSHTEPSGDRALLTMRSGLSHQCESSRTARTAAPRLPRLPQGDDLPPEAPRRTHPQTTRPSHHSSRCGSHP